jgi:hypothetical protein
VGDRSGAVARGAIKPDPPPPPHPPPPHSGSVENTGNTV